MWIWERPPANTTRARRLIVVSLLGVTFSQTSFPLQQICLMSLGRTRLRRGVASSRVIYCTAPAPPPPCNLMLLLRPSRVTYLWLNSPPCNLFVSPCYLIPRGTYCERVHLVFCVFCNVRDFVLARAAPFNFTPPSLPLPSWNFFAVTSWSVGMQIGARPNRLGCKSEPGQKCWDANRNPPKHAGMQIGARPNRLGCKSEPGQKGPDANRGPAKKVRMQIGARPNRLGCKSEPGHKGWDANRSPPKHVGMQAGARPNMVAWCPVSPHTVLG